MLTEIVMPKMGESITEGKILRWTKRVGEKIAKDETLLEISTDKVDSEIPSPVAGVLAKILVAEQETVPVGSVIAMVETDATATIDRASSPPPVAEKKPEPAVETSGAQKSPSPAPLQGVKGGEGGRFLSPLVRAIARREGIGEKELQSLAGSGANGRVRKEDVLKFIAHRAAPSGVRSSFAPVRADVADLAKKYPPPHFRVVAMDNVQRAMAEHMVRSVATSPHVEAVEEVDMTAVAAIRAKEGKKFEEREGFKLTYTPFIASAVVRALKEFPVVNSSVEGDAIVYKAAVHLGIAVASPAGLLVPVVRDADGKNFAGLCRAIDDLAKRTRSRKLLPDEVTGGTFSITNYGVFGTIIGTPIINQPQVAILGVGAIKRRPVVLIDEKGDEAIAIRSMAYLTLAFDHRVIDGAIGGQFLARVKAHLEHFDMGEIF